MTIRNKRRPPRVAAPGEAQHAPETPPAEPVPDDLAAETERLRAEAAALREQGGRDRAQGADLVAAARERAAQLVGEAEAAAQVLTAGATAAERQATQLAERGRYMHAAAEAQASAEAAERQAETITAERDGLYASIAVLDSETSQAQRDREAATTQLATALERGDVARVSELRATIASLGAILAERDGRRGVVEVRLSETDGELAIALLAAQDSREELRRLLYELFPDTPEAIRARALDELVAVAEANMDRIRTEASRPPQPPRTIIR